MLETVRAYAALELTAAGERDEAMEGLAGYCTREAALASEGMIGPAQIEWLDRVRDELESYRSAMAWLIEHTRPAETAAVATGLMSFWLMRGHLSEGLQWYEQTLTLPSLSPSAEAECCSERRSCRIPRETSVAHRPGSHAPWRSLGAQTKQWCWSWLTICSGTLTTLSAISTQPANDSLARLKSSVSSRFRGALEMR
jgi:hypothetical protein